MSIRLTSLQQQVQKELEGLENETRGMREHLAAKDAEMETLRRALRALGGLPEEPTPDRRKPTSSGEAATVRTLRERTVIREGIGRHLRERPGLKAVELATLIEAEWGDGPISPQRIVRMITFMPEVIGDWESGYVYVPAEGDADGGTANRSK